MINEGNVHGSKPYEGHYMYQATKILLDYEYGGYNKYYVDGYSYFIYRDNNKAKGELVDPLNNSSIPGCHQLYAIETWIKESTRYLSWTKACNKITPRSDDEYYHNHRKRIIEQILKDIVEDWQKQTSLNDERRFNEFCSEIIGGAYVLATYINYDPYNNITQLSEVVEKIMRVVLLDFAILDIGAGLYRPNEASDGYTVLDKMRELVNSKIKFEELLK